MSKIVVSVPKMLNGEQLDLAATNLPKYSSSILKEDQATRLIALNNLYDIYLSNQMTREIYSKMYLALYRSLEKKDTREAVIQSNRIFRKDKLGVNGGTDCISFLGDSGIGKTSAINQAIKLLNSETPIVITNPYRKIIPIITVQTPFDCSAKSLLLEILRQVDIHLDTKYYDYAILNKATVDNLIGTVSQIALQHIGLIIADEIQNVVKANKGRNLVGCLTQLINNAGISIVMVGTPGCESFFEEEMFLARRCQGMRYGALKYDDNFIQLCSILLKYQYVKNKVEISDSFIYWLYQKCLGNVSVLVSLIHDAQEIAILNGSETLDKESIQEAYDTRLSPMKIYLEPKVKTGRNIKQTSISHNKYSPVEISDYFSDIVSKCKKEGFNAIELLQEECLLETIKV